MFKKQMLAQKIVCYLALAAAVFLFIATIGMSTDLYQILYPCVSKALGEEMGLDGAYEYVKGASVYLDIQPFNMLAVRLALALIVISLLSFVAGTNRRRKYYLFNYIATAVICIAFIAVATYVLSQVLYWKNEFLTGVDFDSESKKSLVNFAASTLGKARGVIYDKSTLWLDINIVATVVVLVTSVLYLLNSVWKFILCRAEDKLLQQSASQLSLDNGGNVQ